MADYQSSKPDSFTFTVPDTPASRTAASKVAAPAAPISAKAGYMLGEGVDKEHQQPGFGSSGATTRTQDEMAVIAALRRLGIPNVQASDFEKLRPSDRFAEELEVMAEVKAYFKVAYKVRYPRQP